MATQTKEKEETKGTAAKGFLPLGDRIFVTYTEELERTAGGIYVPDSAREKPQRGTVEGVGKEVKIPESRRSGPFRQIFRNQNQDRKR